MTWPALTTSRAWLCPSPSPIRAVMSVEYKCSTILGHLWVAVCHTLRNRYTLCANCTVEVHGTFWVFSQLQRLGR